MSRSLTAIILSAAWMLTGCATILGGGGKEKVQFDSEPDGAEVHIDGVQRGTTPTSAKLDKKKSHTVTMKKGECYTHDEVYVTKTLRVGWAVLDGVLILPTLYLSVGIDYLTGAWNTFDKNRVTVTLENTCKGDDSTSGSGSSSDSGCEPDGPEKCDGRDNDCDGTVDENCK